MVDAQLWLLSFEQQAPNARQTSASNQTCAILDVLLLTLRTLQASWQPITSIQAAHNTAPQGCHRMLKQHTDGSKSTAPASACGCSLCVLFRLVCLHRMRRRSSALKRAMWLCMYGSANTCTQQTPQATYHLLCH
jgi:hypothetical protein